MTKTRPLLGLRPTSSLHWGYLSGFSRETEPTGDRLVLKNWLMQSRRPTGPQMCRQQAGGEESQGCECQSEVWQAQGQENPSFSLDQRQEKASVSVEKAIRKEEFPPSHRTISLIFLFRPSTDWMRPTDTRLSRHVNLIQKHLPRHTQNYACINI